MRVLVVDDNVDTARLIAMLLCGEGHDATAVFDGQIAIEEAKARQPDVIILDLGLPGWMAWRFCRQLRLDDRFKRTLLVALLDTVKTKTSSGLDKRGLMSTLSNR